MWTAFLFWVVGQNLVNVGSRLWW